MARTRKVGSLDTKRHRWTDIVVKTSVFKRDIGVKRLPRFLSITKSNKWKIEHSALPVEASRNGESGLWSSRVGE